MITPTNGRIVWYTPTPEQINGQTHHIHAQHNGDDIVPLAADVVAVWSDTLVNLLVKDALGGLHPMPNVRLLQDDEARPNTGGYAEWMPFQKGQAARHAESK